MTQTELEAHIVLAGFIKDTVLSCFTLTKPRLFYKAIDLTNPVYYHVVAHTKILETFYTAQDTWDFIERQINDSE